MLPFRPRLTFSILAFLTCLLLMAWLLFSLFAFKTAANDLYAQKGEYGRTLLAVFTDQLPDSIPTFPDSMVNPGSPPAVFARKLSDDGAFTRLSLLDANGKVIFTAGKEGSDVYLPFAGTPQQLERGYVLPGESTIVRAIPVVRNGAIVGKAGIAVPLNAENQRLQRSQKLFISYFAIDFVLLLGIGSFVLSRIVVSPINRLLNATQKITGGHYGQRIRVSGSAELAQLADSFNEMSEALLVKDQQVSSHVAALEQANQELRRAKEETLRSEKMASIGLLAAGMAHEIGTPLASIMGYAELLSGEQPNQAALQDYIHRISEDCGRIDRIVRGLLDYSRPHTSSIEAVDVPDLINRSIELLSHQGALKRVEVSCQYEEPVPCALADPHQLQQVLINLMLNSRDAMPDGGKLDIRVRAGQNDKPDNSPECLRIDLLDNGCGIPEGSLKNIFEPFFTTKPPGRGTGLGLAISARIIEGFGGSITVISKPDEGSCFTIWLRITSNGRNKESA